MFGKKQPEKPSQSQSLSGVTVNGGMVQLGQAGGDLQQNQSGQLDTQQQISHTEVVTHLETLEAAVDAAALPPAQQEDLAAYLGSAKREAAKEAGSKELVGQNLKQVNETLKTLKDTTETGKSLWQTWQGVLTAIGPWLGAAASLIGL